MAQETNTKRLDRIEEKIDKLSDAMISLARAEEKLIAIENNNHANYQRVNRLSEKIDELSIKVDDNSRTVSVISKMFWIMMVGLVGAISTHFM